jgi:protein-S-isoprenylcysteine O-methyltransferase Ste14
MENSNQPVDAVGAKIHPPLLLGGMLGLLLLYRAFDLPAPLSKKARFVGLPILLAGLFLGGAAVRAQLRAGTTPDPDRPVKAIVQSGPYRVTRNPMYLSMGLILGGIALLLNAVGGLLLVPVFLLALDQGQVRPEEAYLERKFGNVYLQYKQRVRRWL